MKLIVGLGNPGAQYQKTRHNVGFMALDHLAQAFNFEPFKEAEKFRSHLTEGQAEDEKLILVKPQIFMNLSGSAVQALQSYYKVDPSDILVIYDEVELPIGTLRVRPDGSSGGHNGIASVMRELKTMTVPRVRIGIKPEQPFPGALEHFVLGNLTSNEAKSLQPVFDKLPKLITTLITEGIEKVMNEYN